jgi:outer membrane lipoprotein-sorting protein
MRRDLIPAFLFALAIGAGIIAPSVAAPPSQQGPIPFVPHFTDTDRADMKRISEYLNTLQSVQGRFVQVGASGKSEQGTFYLRKPGRVRFEYEKPSPNLVIADGTTVAVENTALHTTDRYPLGNSPLRLLLSQNIDLARDSRISALKREAGAISMTARETSGPAAGSITLVFSDSGGSLELRQWNVVDAQGARTSVVVNEMRQVADLRCAALHSPHAQAPSRRRHPMRPQAGRRSCFSHGGRKIHRRGARWLGRLARADSGAEPAAEAGGHPRFRRRTLVHRIDLQHRAAPLWRSAGAPAHAAR